MQFLRVKNWDEFQQYNDGRPIHWIKFHLSVLDDYTIDCLSETGQFHLFKIWLLAAKLGNKIPDDAAWVGQKIGAQSEVDLNQLVTLGLLVPYETVRDCTATAGPPYVEKRREEKNREEKKEKEPAQQPRKRGQRLPADWQPSEELKDWAVRERPDLGPDIKRTIDSFTDYWQAKTGASACKLDWDATFRNWVRNERQTPRPRSSTGPVRETNDERRSREADEYRRAILAG